MFRRLISFVSGYRSFLVIVVIKRAKLHRNLGVPHHVVSYTRHFFRLLSLILRRRQKGRWMFPTMPQRRKDKSNRIGLLFRVRFSRINCPRGSSFVSREGVFPRARFRRPHENRTTQKGTNGVRHSSFQTTFRKVNRVRRRVNGLLFQGFLLQRRLQRNLTSHAHGFQMLPRSPLRSKVIRTPLVRSNTTRHHKGVHRGRFVGVTIFGRVSFNVLASILSRLLRLMHRAQVRTFIGGVVVRIARRVTRRVDRRGSFTSHVRLLHVNYSFDGGLLQRVRGFLISLSHVKLFRRLTTSQSTVRKGHRRRGRGLRLPVARIKGTKLSSFPRWFLDGGRLLLVSRLRGRAFFVFRFEGIGRIMLVSLSSRGVNRRGSTVLFTTCRFVTTISHSHWKRAHRA